MGWKWWSRIRSRVLAVLWFVLGIAIFTLIFVLSTFAIISTLVPGLGPLVIPDAVTAAASLALALIAAVTIQEGRRNSRTELVTKKLERLYSPLFHEVEESGGYVLGPKTERGISAGAPPPGMYWENYVEPLISGNLHLASPELVDAYWRVKRRKASEKEFCDRVRTDFHRLVGELTRLSGRR